MSDKTAFLSALAIRLPGVSLANALGIIEDAERFLSTPAGPDVSTPEGLIAFARTLPEVGVELRRGRKIQAIKELRTKAREVAPLMVGLLEAKNAVEALAKEAEYQPAPAPIRTCCTSRTDEYHRTWCMNY